MCPPWGYTVLFTNCLQVVMLKQPCCCPPAHCGGLHDPRTLPQWSQLPSHTNRCLAVGRRRCSLQRAPHCLFPGCVWVAVTPNTVAQYFQSLQRTSISTKGPGRQQTRAGRNKASRQGETRPAAGGDGAGAARRYPPSYGWPRLQLLGVSAGSGARGEGDGQPGRRCTPETTRPSQRSEEAPAARRGTGPARPQLDEARLYPLRTAAAPNAPGEGGRPRGRRALLPRRGCYPRPYVESR